MPRYKFNKVVKEETLLKSHFGVDVLLCISWIISEHLTK